MKPKPSLRSLLFCFSSLVFIANAQAEVTISDTFKLGGADRQLQSVVDKTKTESGGAIWAATPQFLFGGDDQNGWVIPGTKPGAGLVPLPSDVKRVQIDLDVKVSADNVGWIAVGVGASGNPTSGNFPGGIFLYIDSNGNSQIRADGLRIKVGGKPITDFHRDDFNHLQLIYDKETNSVSATINSTAVLCDSPLGDFTPDLSFGGFSHYAANQNSRIDNFAIKVEGGDKCGVAALPPKPVGVYRILFIGDSITHSRANPAKQWTINAGMAASAENKDYVSLVSDAVSKDLNLKVEKKVFAEYGGKVEGYIGRAAEYRAFQPDLVVLQFGENERGTPAEFETVYQSLLKDISGLAQKPVIVCAGIWAPGLNAYVGRWGEMENVVKKLAVQYGAAYVPVDKYASDPTCRGAGANAGVQWHPNDAGMKGYANGIFAAWKKLNPQHPTLK